MRYYELNEEMKRKYGEALFKIIEFRKENQLGADKIEDYILVDNLDGELLWIYYPDID